MRESLLLDVLNRQVVFTIPKMLRLFFRFRRKLLNSLCLCVVRALVKFLHTATGLELMPGMVAVLSVQDGAPAHRGQINGSTSKTFLIISAQPFDGTNETSSSIIGGWEG